MMPAKKPISSSSDKKVMDINSPGTATPGATSRPVIVSHKPMIEDPMVSKAAPEVPSAPTLAGKGKTIQPLSSSSAVDAPKKPDSSEEKVEVTVTQADKPKPEQVKSPVKEETKDTSVAQNAVEEVSPESADDLKEGNSKKKAEIEAAEKAAQEKYEKIIQEKTYFVPVDQSVSSSSASKVFTTILAFVLVAGIIGLLAIDAGLIETNIDLPFDFIKNEA